MKHSVSETHQFASSSFSYLPSIDVARLQTKCSYHSSPIVCAAARESMSPARRSSHRQAVLPFIDTLEGRGSVFGMHASISKATRRELNRHRSLISALSGGTETCI